MYINRNSLFTLMENATLCHNFTSLLLKKPCAFVFSRGNPLLHISQSQNCSISQTHDVSNLVTQLINNRFTRPYNNLSKNSYHLFRVKNLHVLTKFAFTFYVIMVGSLITFVPESDCLKHHCDRQYLIQEYD